MLAQQIGKRYATALFELAREKNLLDQAWEEFDALAEYFRKDHTFIDFISAPQISSEDKAALIKKVFQNRMEKPFYDFIRFLTEKHRIKYLPEIIDEFDHLVRAERGIVRVTCITTYPITGDARALLLQRLTAKTGLKIELEEKIDRSIIGGMVIILRDRIIDGSLRFALSQLKNRLMKVKVH
jgi:F-type H+-transporting ATPase subunit delta